MGKSHKQEATIEHKNVTKLKYVQRNFRVCCIPCPPSA